MPGGGCQSQLLEGSMKQNERLLVYAVTGFLALILLVAVVFGRAPENQSAVKTGGTVQDLKEVVPSLGAANPPAGNANAAPNGNANGGVVGSATGVGLPAGNSGLPAGNSGLPAPGQLVPEQPLMAQAKPMVVADLVAQSLGLSRRDRNVRFVRAKSGDSLDTLVRRWCGARDPFLAEAQSLNEDLVVLRVGQEVALPWVDDEVLAAGLEQQKPKTAVVEDMVDVARLAAEASARRNGSVPAAVGNPAIGSPAGSNAPVAPVGNGLAAPAATVATTTYVVKKGDALWRIAERTYGRKNADRMIGEIKAVNPGMSDSLREGQKIQLPKADAPKADAGATPTKP
jgi:nucleoid-associated protein YgaU